MSENFNISGMGKACSDSRYVEFVKDTVKTAMEGEKTISLNKAISIFQQYNNELNENDINKIEKVAMKDGNEDVNEREMATIYTLLDAELGSDNKFHMDGNISDKKVKFGLQEAYEEEIKAVYDSFKTDDDIEAEKQQQLKIKNAALAKTKEIVGEYPEINLEKYAQIKLAAEIPLDNYFSSFKGKLNKLGIEYTEADDGTITYKLGDKTCITKETEHMCVTTIMDNEGNTVQTIRSSGIRDNTNGILVTNYNDGKKQNSAHYSSSDNHECEEVSEYHYDKNGNIKQEVSRSSCYTYVTKYQDNERIQYRMSDGILFYKDDNGNISKYTKQNLANLQE